MPGPRQSARRRRRRAQRAAPFRCRLVVMAKLPVAGGVKTRLAREIGVAGATRFARHAAAALLQRVGTIGAGKPSLAVAPDAAWEPRWPRGVARMPQGGGDLGRRMQRIFERTPPGPVLIVGTDVPGITPAHIAEAFRLLGRHDAVFGPATDGGYWLVGLAAAAVLRPSPASAGRAGTRSPTRWPIRRPPVAFVATLGDVDERARLALRAALGPFGRAQGSLAKSIAPFPRLPHKGAHAQARDRDLRRDKGMTVASIAAHERAAVEVEVVVVRGVVVGARARRGSSGRHGRARRAGSAPRRPRPPMAAHADAASVGEREAADVDGVGGGMLAAPALPELGCR